MQQFSHSSGIVLNTEQTFAYIVNSGSGTLVACPIQSNGNLGTCVDSGIGSAPFNAPTGLALNPNVDIAYVVNDGSLIDCMSSSDPRFAAPSGTALFNNFLD
jgi:DNA-binding beta-propeller fold protein YncE